MSEYLHIERIENYFGGKLSKEEKSVFETDLLQDQQLQKEVELYKKSNIAIEQLKKDYLKQRIKDHIQKEETKSSEKNSNFTISYKHILIAASFIILIGATSLFLINRSYCDTCLADHSSFEVFTGNIRGEDEDMVGDLNRINQLINKGQFDEALEEINDLDIIAENSSIIEFFKIKIFINNNDMGLAHQQIQILQRSDQQLISDLADWQMIQYFLLNKEAEEATQLVEKIISNPKHGYQSKAKQLRKKLDSSWRSFIL